MEYKKDLRGFMLADHRIYALFKKLVLPRRSARQRVDRFIRPRQGARILDIGCGVADILDLLPDVDYTGLDSDPGYIEAAERRYGRKAVFILTSVEEYRLKDPESYDIVLADGILHHLNDKTAGVLLQTAKSALKHEGLFVSFDPVFLDGQNPVARYVISMDRGRHVRSREGYAGLVRKVFPTWETHICRRTLRIPYDHCVINAWKMRPGTSLPIIGGLDMDEAPEAK